MTSLSIDILVPHSPEAIAKGCSCPDADMPLHGYGVVLCCGGHVFDPRCPVHRNAVLAEVQRIMGWQQ